jgi:hypothetical protein
MGFTAVITKKDVMGSHRTVMGTFSQISGDTGGVVATGLRKVENFQMIGATKLTVSGGNVTVVTADPLAAQAGFFLAIGM